MKRFYLFLPFLICCLFLISCKNKTGDGNIINNPLSASGVTDDNLPVIEFENDYYDFKEVIQGEKVSYRFKFKNTGKTDLLLSNVSSSCGCTTPEYSKEPVAPGGEGFVTVSFNSENRQGAQHKSVTVMSNTIPNSVVLHIKAVVISPEKNF